METYLLFFVASIVAGTINAVAGGGGLITFPLLMLVASPVTADATSAIACFSAYPTTVWRTCSQLQGIVGSGWFWLLLIPRVVGGLVGALLLAGLVRHRYHPAATDSGSMYRRRWRLSYCRLPKNHCAER